MKKILDKILGILKKRRNIPIIILSVVVLIISLFTIGIVKTLILTIIVIVIAVVTKYGGIFMSKLKRQKTTKVKNKVSKNKVKRILNKLGIIVLMAGIFSLIAGSIFIAYIVITAPKFDPKNLYRKEASVIYDDNNQVVAKLGREIRDKISYDDMPQVLIDAIIATEDSRFLQHNGFDLPRFAKATFGQLLGRSGAGGGSTITMQVAKNNFNGTDQTITRKFKDIYLSIFEIEKHYTKEQILEFYVNAPFLGHNSYGVAEASRNYFGKEIQNLNLAEASLLAGLFQAPSSYDPYLHPENATKRRATVLYLMRRHGYISAEEEKAANAIPVSSLLNQNGYADSTEYQGYIDIVIDEVIKKTGNDPAIVPMKIYTNLSTPKQQSINKILAGDGYKWENDFVQSGIAVQNVNTGGIVAIGNGRNRTGARILSYAEMKRQIGSNAKPIFDYGPGMEYNNWSTYTPFLDDSYTYSDGKPINDWDGQYDGLLTSRIALSTSRNIPALKAFQQLNNKDILTFATSLGMTPEVQDGRLHEAHSIGAFNGTSPIQMAAAYSAFSNGGYYIEPHTVNKITYIDNNKDVIFNYDKTKVMSDSTAFMITDILRSGVDSGDIGGGKVNGVQVAAKSGTSNFDSKTKEKYNMSSNAINDLWYTGYSTEYAIGMWYGYEKIDGTHYSKMNYSSSYRNKLFTALANAVFKGNKQSFTVPSSVVKVNIEKDSIPAMLPSNNTPSNMITTEYFKAGTEPTDISPRFNTLANPTKLNAVYVGTDVQLSWNIVTPVDTVTSDYLDVIKGHTDKYLSIRNNYDASVLGDLGYNVYRKNTDGTLTFLGFTKDTKDPKKGNSYSDIPPESGDVTYVVKTCYSIFKASMSSGASFTLSDNGTPDDVSVITASLKGSSPVTTQINGTYAEPGVTIKNNGIPVTDQITNSSYTIVITDSTNNIVTLANALTKAGTYTITYSITYKGETIAPNLTRKLIVQ